MLMNFISLPAGLDVSLQLMANSFTRNKSGVDFAEYSYLESLHDIYIYIYITRVLNE
jgi:hypothetical protein